MNLPYLKHFVFLFIAALLAVYPAANASAQTSGISISVTTDLDRIYKLTGAFRVEAVIENNSSKPVQITGIPMAVLRSTTLEEKNGEVMLFAPFHIGEKTAKGGWLAAGAKDELAMDLAFSYTRWSEVSETGSRRTELFKALKYGDYALTVEFWESDKTIPRAGSALRTSAPVTISYREEKMVDWSGIAITLVASGDELKKGEPFAVTAIVENRGDIPFPLGSLPGFVLTGEPIVRDGFTYPPQRFRASPERKNNPAYFTKDLLLKGEKVDVSADLTSLGWYPGNASIIVFEDLFDLISKESYRLTVEIYEPKDRADGPSTQVLKSAPLNVIYK